MNLKSYLTIFSLLAGFFIVWLVFLNLSQNKIPQLVSSNPENGAKNVSSTAPLNFYYNIPLDSNKFTFQITPDVKWKTPSVVGSTLTLVPEKYLASATKYTLKISYNKREITTLVFTTASGQGDPQYYQQVQELMARDYPLADKFPYTTDNYKVVYSAPRELEIRLKSNAISSDTAIAEIKSYVTKNGGDAGAHKYTVIPFTQ